MTTMEEKIVLVSFAFMMIYLTFPICKARIRSTLNLLKYNIEA